MRMTMNKMMIKMIKKKSNRIKIKMNRMKKNQNNKVNNKIKNYLLLKCLNLRHLNSPVF
jgi:hypothetical protein